MERLKNILLTCGAAEVGIIKFSDCQIINKRLLNDLGFIPQSICIGIIPYYTHFCDKKRTVSAYALAYDYHSLIKQIGEKAVDTAKLLYPEANFKYYGDHSPINEKEAAAKAGLGIIGAHSLLITPKYSSFVFLFEIFTDLKCDYVAQNIQFCEMCGNCINACPGILSGHGECLSAITQKKGSLTKEESDMIVAGGSVWGCDICQNVCPHTLKAIADGTIYTHLQWFNENIIAIPDNQSIEDQDDFKHRAYSWRGKTTISRNIDILNQYQIEIRGSNG